MDSFALTYQMRAEIAAARAECMRAFWRQIAGVFARRA